MVEVARTENAGGGEMSKFKEGEKVVFYSDGARRIGVIKVGVIKEIVDCSGYEVRELDGMFWWCHEKQLRKLKPKRKAREWVGFVDKHGYVFDLQACSFQLSDEVGDVSRPIRLREVIKK